MADLFDKQIDASSGPAAPIGLQFEQDPAVLAMIRQLEEEGKLKDGKWIGEDTNSVTVRVSERTNTDVTSLSQTYKEPTNANHNFSNATERKPDVVLGRTSTKSITDGPRFTNNGTAIGYPGIGITQIVTPRKQMIHMDSDDSDEESGGEYEKAKQRVSTEEHDRVQSATIRSFVVERSPVEERINLDARTLPIFKLEDLQADPYQAFGYMRLLRSVCVSQQVALEVKDKEIKELEDKLATHVAGVNGV